MAEAIRINEGTYRIEDNGVRFFLLEGAEKAILIDTVYPSHGDFPVYPDIIEKLISGAERIMNGEAIGKKVAVHGTDVLLYRFSFAGFYAELPSGE